MGEIADSIIEGEICQMCCCSDGREPQGYPYTCAECGGSDADGGDPTNIPPRPTSPKVPCPICDKMIHEIGMHQHVAAKHPEAE